jgi:hypothetical protein
MRLFSHLSPAAPVPGAAKNSATCRSLQAVLLIAALMFPPGCAGRALSPATDPHSQAQALQQRIQAVQNNQNLSAAQKQSQIQELQTQH